MSLTPRLDRLEVNYIYNSAMEIWQRGTTISSVTALDANYYVADRWQHRFEASSGTADNTMQRFQDAPADTPLRYSARIASGGAASSNTVVQNIFRQVLEKSETRKLISSGKLTISFYYKSNLTGTHAVSLDIQGFTGANPAAQTFEVESANTWTLYELTFDVSSKANNDDGTTAENAAGLLLNIGPRTGGLGQTDWASGDNAYLTGVMLVEGDQASEWSLKGKSPQRELALCQRYYEKSYAANVDPGTPAGNWNSHFVFQDGTRSYVSRFRYKVEKRAAASLTFYPFDGSPAGNMTFRRAGTSHEQAAGGASDNNTEGFTLATTITDAGFGNADGFAYPAFLGWTADAEL